MDFASLEHLKIVDCALFFANAYDFSAYAIDYNQVFYGVALLFAGVGFFLFF